jgi:hypothetical protein
MRSVFLQMGWCGILGYWIFIDGMRVVEREPDCFASIGVYSVCYSTESISIYITLFLLMFQAFMIRIFIPGMSIFVNESVGHFRKIVNTLLLFSLLSYFCKHLTDHRFYTEEELRIKILLPGLVCALATRCCNT